MEPGPLNDTRFVGYRRKLIEDIRGHGIEDLELLQVIAYELRLAAGAALDPPAEYDRPATAAELEGFHRHLEEVMTAAGFLDPEQPKWLMRRLRRLFARAAPESAEINILRGLLKALDPRGR